MSSWGAWCQCRLPQSRARIAAASEHELDRARRQIAAIDRPAHDLRHRRSGWAPARGNIEIDVRHGMPVSRRELHLPGPLAGIDWVQRDRQTLLELFLQMRALEACDQL